MYGWKLKILVGFSLKKLHEGLLGSAEQLGVILTQAARARSGQYSPYPDFIRSPSKDLNPGKTRDLPFGNRSGMACVIP